MLPKAKLPSGGDDGCRSKRKLSIALKKRIVENYERGMRVSDLSRMYQRSSSTICTILKQKELLKVASPAHGTTVITKQRTINHDNMEKMLVTWMVDKQLAAEIITESMICEQARNFYAELVRQTPAATEEASSAAEPFKASRGWFQNFKKRTGINNSDDGDGYTIEPNLRNIDDCGQYDVEDNDNPTSPSSYYKTMEFVHPMFKYVESSKDDTEKTSDNEKSKDLLDVEDIKFEISSNGTDKMDLEEAEPPDEDNKNFLLADMTSNNIAKNEPDETVDEDLLFFKSMLGYMKILPRTRKLALKLKFHEMLLQEVEQQENKPETS